MTPQTMKIRADIELKCFQFDGVLHIKEAMRKAEAAGNDECPVKMSLIGPPLYVLNTQTLDKETYHTFIEQQMGSTPEGGSMQLAKEVGKNIWLEASCGINRGWFLEDQRQYLPEEFVLCHYQVRCLLRHLM